MQHEIIEEIRASFSKSWMFFVGFAVLWLGILSSGCGPGQYFTDDRTDQNDPVTIVNVTQRMEQSDFVLLDKQKGRRKAAWEDVDTLFYSIFFSWSLS